MKILDILTEAVLDPEVDQLRSQVIQQVKNTNDPDY